MAPASRNPFSQLLGIARRKLKRAIQLLLCRIDPPGTELQFRHAFPGETKIRRFGDCRLCGLQRCFNLIMRLPGIRLRQPFRSGLRRIRLPHQAFGHQRQYLPSRPRCSKSPSPPTISFQPFPLVQHSKAGRPAFCACAGWRQIALPRKQRHCFGNNSARAHAACGVRSRCRSCSSPGQSNSSTSTTPG